jgi:hypothetical protein
VLAHLSIDNLLKGLIVMKNPREHVRDGRFRGNVMTNHHLPTLATVAGVTFAPDEETFAVVSTTATFGWGRYPVALLCTDTPAVINADANSGYLFDQLFRRLAQLIIDRGYGADTPSAYLQVKHIK